MNSLLNVLYIDDEPEHLIVFKSSFKRNFNVFVANSTKKAWPILETELIQVVISDQRMPEQTGTEFFTDLKEKRPDIIRILLTGYADFDDVIIAINEGKIFHYLNKPWDRTQLNNIIDKGFQTYQLKANNKLLIDKLEQHNKELERRVSERTADLAATNELLEKKIAELEEINQELNELNTVLSKNLNTGASSLGFEQELNEELEQKSKEITAYSLQLIQKNKVLEELKAELKNIMANTDSSVNKKFRSLVGLIDYSFSVEKEWERFRHVFENVHKSFYEKLDKTHPELSQSERKLAALTKLNLNSKEIADILGISQDSLKTARHRLRKKLLIPTDENLSSYINNF